MPQPGHVVKLLDADLNEVSVGEEGMIAITEDDPACFCAIGTSRKKTARVRRGGWFLTGDYARRDADGYFWFLGRRDDIIKSFGYRVSPFEVERVLKDHPAVADSAVIGEEVGPDKTIIAAYVLLAPGTSAGGRRSSPTPASTWPATNARVPCTSSAICRARRMARCCGGLSGNNTSYLTTL